MRKEGNHTFIGAVELNPFSQDSQRVVMTPGGLYLPVAGNGFHLPSKDSLLDTKEQARTIDFVARASVRPREWNEYMTLLAEGTEGRPKFNFENKKYESALKYVSGSYDRFKVRTEEVLEKYVKVYGAKDVDDLREKMMAGVSIVEDGAKIVPFDYHKPNMGHYGKDFFYWDSLWSAKWAKINNDPAFIKGTINNLRYIYRLAGYIPNSNQDKIGDRSQPFFSPLVFLEALEVIPDTPENHEWRKETVSFLKSEYFHVWVNDPEGESKYDTYTKPKSKSSLWHNQAITPTGLSRYASADIVANGYSNEAATGEDIGSRFEGETHKYNPTDLAALRGIAQKVFAQEALAEGNVAEAAYWDSKFEETKELANQLMWNEEKGWYMDYNFVDKKQSNVMALAAFLLVQAGMVPKERLDRMVGNLDKFTLPYGLAVTTGEEPQTPGREGKESWRFPNRWAPREDMVYDVLMPYEEYHDKLEELMIRSQIGSTEFHNRYKTENYQTMPEVLDGETGELGGSALYPRKVTHEGFMWTHVTFLENERRLKEIENRRNSLALAA